MKALLIGTFLALFSIMSVSAEPIDISQALKQNDAVYHGGGCRKSSPAGQCCHRDSSTGTVHYH